MQFTYNPHEAGSTSHRIAENRYYNSIIEEYSASYETSTSLTQTVKLILGKMCHRTCLVPGFSTLGPCGLKKS